MVSPVGIEPTTNRLKVGCSTAELQALTKTGRAAAPRIVGGLKLLFAPQSQDRLDHRQLNNGIGVLHLAA